MKVAELIDKLLKFDDDLEVQFYIHEDTDQGYVDITAAHLEPVVDEGAEAPPIVCIE